MARVLAGDVGGSKVRLVAVDDRTGPGTKHVYPSHRYASFSAILADFLKREPGRIDYACFGVAGPVIEGTVRMTNLRWTLDTESLQRRLRCPVAIINDVEAAAYGLEHVKEPIVLSVARPRQGTKVVLIPGTGLGESIAHWRFGKRTILPSEGGHVDFAPRNALQWDLKRYLRDDTSVEGLLSGRGLITIYNFLKSEQFARESDQVREEINKHGPPAITLAALRKDPLSVGTAELFTVILAGEAQRLALTATAIGGVYLAGNIVHHILPILQSYFLKHFLNSPMRRLLERMPVVVAMDEELVLDGALAYLKAQEFAGSARR